ncbi:MAG: class I mannose-6-phosphate isomerase [Anaerolineaceae bacterium]|nr:class I mannose-6-phosphate isomerase [Anaerolineaceae bacterium]
MGYFINPVNFEDLSARNLLHCPDLSVNSGNLDQIASSIMKNLKPGLIIVDGYIASQIDKLGALLGEKLQVQTRKAEEFWISQSESEDLIKDYLPQNKEIDPNLIFAKLFNGKLEQFFDRQKADSFINSLDTSQTTVLYGIGASSDYFLNKASTLIFVDCTPFQSALRLLAKEYTPLGGQVFSGSDELIRQVYSIDLELVVKNRRKLLQGDLVNFYVSDQGPDNFRLLNYADLLKVAKSIASGPIRPKPIYIEGVWGGQYIKRIRQIPDSVVSKVAWSFELIATEASVAMDVGEVYLDLPFLTLMDLVGEKMVGAEDYERYKGYLPVRFNYDDTWHSNGNMSIQCHPNDEMAQNLYNDFAGQSEGYYIVVAGQKSKTFCGFKADGRKFLELAKKSETTGAQIDYEKYINAVESIPGRQFFLPPGTVHSSGRNQLVLEIGSLTISAYTYKIYDYARMDITGKPRPIHTKLSERALRFERDTDFVKNNLVFDPINPVENQSESKKYSLGKSKLVPFTTAQIEVRAGGTYAGNTAGRFVCLALVDGESAKIVSSADSERCYHARYLDVVFLPASLGEYSVEAGSDQPIILHETRLAGD